MPLWGEAANGERGMAITPTARRHSASNFVDFFIICLFIARTIVSWPKERGRKLQRYNNAVIHLIRPCVTTFTCVHCDRKRAGFQAKSGMQNYGGCLR